MYLHTNIVHQFKLKPTSLIKRKSIKDFSNQTLNIQHLKWNKLKQKS